MHVWGNGIMIQELCMDIIYTMEFILEMTANWHHTVLAQTPIHIGFNIRQNFEILSSQNTVIRFYNTTDTYLTCSVTTHIHYTLFPHFSTTKKKLPIWQFPKIGVPNLWLCVYSIFVPIWSQNIIILLIRCHICSSG